MDNTRDVKLGSAHTEKISGLQEVKTHAAGNVVLVDESGDVRKLPVPSNDPADPLNFTAWQKGFITLACCWFCEFYLSSYSKCHV